jgi:hypothetical protein
MAEQPTPTPGVSRGNRTTGRAHLENGWGNRTPEALRSIDPKFAAQAVIPKYNAESTYNNWSNDRAAGHLNDLAGHLKNLFDATQNRQAHRALSMTTEAQAKASTAGFTAHPDIIGEAGGTYKGVSWDAKPGAMHDVLDRLGNIDPKELSGAAQQHLSNAVSSAKSVLGEFHPAIESEFKGSDSPKGRVSVEIDPEYRANIFDYPRPKSMTEGDWDAEMKTTPDGRYSLKKQGKLKDADSYRSDASKQQKADRRRQRAAELKAAKLAGGNK